MFGNFEISFSLVRQPYIKLNDFDKLTSQTALANPQQCAIYKAWATNLETDMNKAKYQLNSNINEKHSSCDIFSKRVKNRSKRTEKRRKEREKGKENWIDRMATRTLYMNANFRNSDMSWFDVELNYKVEKNSTHFQLKERKRIQIKWDQIAIKFCYFFIAYIFHT